MVLSNIIWIESNIEGNEYLKEIESLGYYKINFYKNINEAIMQIKNIEFEETIIIVKGDLYFEFIEKFQDNLKNFYIIPKIIIFVENKEEFINKNKDKEYLLNHPFYNSGGIIASFEDIKKFILNPTINIKKKLVLNREDEGQLVFEYIDCKEKLLLPLLYKTLIEVTPNDKIEEFTDFLYNKYAKNNKELKKLFDSFKDLSNIPFELLSKYYIRIYTEEESNFYSDLNKDLRINKKDIYLPYIKVLYEGIRLKSLPLANNSILYRGSILSNNEIEKIKKYLNNKIEGLPSSIIFSKAFLSFTKDRLIAENFINLNKNKTNELSKVLFILEKEDNIDFSLSTHADIEKISYFPIEREVLFFPFSSFEIQGIKEIKMNDEEIYEIKLLYLGKYIKEIQKDNNYIEKENILPDSEFKKQIVEFGLIKPENTEINAKKLIKEYEKYSNDIKSNKNDKDKRINCNIRENKINTNYIISEINIGEKDINKLNGIIYGKTELQFENGKTLEENCEIQINDERKDFSLYYKFEKQGKYKIKYTFKSNLIKCNYLFNWCDLLICIDLSNLNTRNVTSMHCMFLECRSLESINFSNIETQNVETMKSMFNGCRSLINLDLSNFNTDKVNDMDSMFNKCSSLIKLDLSNFNTKNVTNMNNMFNCCSSLSHLDISSFNTEKVEKMGSMFGCCESLTNLNLSNFNTENVTNMDGMFSGCHSLKELDLSSFNTHKVIRFSGIFSQCSQLKTLNISNFNTQNANFMDNMFNNCTSIKNLDLSDFNTENVYRMDKMFYGCSSLISLDLSKFTGKDNKFMFSMFDGCISLKEENLKCYDNDIIKEFNNFLTKLKS